MVVRSLRTLLTELIDYAGLFPPAGLGMEPAVRSYAEYKRGEHAWMLGRFVVPVARLEEFERAVGTAAATGWRLSVLSAVQVGEDPYAALAGDLREVVAFNDRHSARTFQVDAVEINVGGLGTVRTSMGALEDARREGLQVDAFCEVPLSAEMPAFLDALAEAGAFAKMRTGGVTADAFPAASEVARFIHGCHVRGLTFKATAGLHHPMRGPQRLTYEPDSECGTMHGFLNVFLAAGFLREGMGEAEAVELLEEASPEAFRFTDDGVAWRGHCLTTDTLRRAREFARSFGSCSFTDPIEDLRAMNLL